MRALSYVCVEERGGGGRLYITRVEGVVMRGPFEISMSIAIVFTQASLSRCNLWWWRRRTG